MDKKPASAALRINKLAYPYDRPRIGTVVTKYGQYIPMYVGDKIRGTIAYGNEANSRWIQDKDYFPDARTIYYKDIYLIPYESQIVPFDNSPGIQICQGCGENCIYRKKEKEEPERED